MDPRNGFAPRRLLARFCPVVVGTPVREQRIFIVEDMVDLVGAHHALHIAAGLSKGDVLDELIRGGVAALSQPAVNVALAGIVAPDGQKHVSTEAILEKLHVSGSDPQIGEGIKAGLPGDVDVQPFSNPTGGGRHQLRQAPGPGPGHNVFVET